MNGIGPMAPSAMPLLALMGCRGWEATASAMIDASNETSRWLIGCILTRTEAESRRQRQAGRSHEMTMKRLRHIAIICFAILSLNLISVSTAHAVELSLSDLNLVGCDEADPESAQPERYRSGCYILNGQINNSGESTIENVDVFAFIYDASDEEVLPNRPRIGSLSNVPPGESAFVVRVPVPSFAAPPFSIRKAKARKAVPVPTLPSNGEDDDLLPLERSINQKGGL